MWKTIRFIIFGLAATIAATLAYGSKRWQAATDTMHARFGMSLFVRIAWLFVGGIITFWIGADQTPWRVVGILITVIGIVGMNLAVAERNRTRASP